MWQILAIILAVTATILFYLSNKHQGYLLKPINKFWRVMGYFCFIFSLVAWLQVLVVSAAIFIWLFTNITIMTVIPLLSLNKRLMNIFSDKQKGYTS